MLFNSIDFLIFFPIVVLVYFALPFKIKNFWLLIASYYFYMCWNARYAVLILFSTIVTYVSGILIEKIKSSGVDDRSKENLKRCVVGVSVFLNLSLLLYFKYFNFILNELANILGIIHITLNVPVFDIILPVGISFYTFQALSYTIDVYRDEIYAERSFSRYALFVSFFPQLVAGPIERSKNILKQLSNPKSFNFADWREGILLMLWGYFLKIVLADRIAIYVDTVYEDYEMYGGWYLIVATILFAVQIYCDFYGYSVIAMGAAYILGIQLMENFEAPYLSTSIAKFWKRWHISLTSWFKDYLYIPMGGNRKGKVRKNINKMIVFSVSGLWHGASLSFVTWGGINGLYQVIGDVLQPLRDKMIKMLNLNRESLGHKLAQMFGTFILVDFSWIFFRAESFKDSFEIIGRMISIKNPWILFDGSLYKCGIDEKNWGIMIICIGILLFADILKYKKISVRKIILKQDYWFRWLFVAATVCFILTFGIWGTNYDANGFIYFQF